MNAAKADEPMDKPAKLEIYSDDGQKIHLYIDGKEVLGIMSFELKAGIDEVVTLAINLAVPATEFRG